MLYNYLCIKILDNLHFKILFFFFFFPPVTTSPTCKLYKFMIWFHPRGTFSFAPYNRSPTTVTHSHRQPPRPSETSHTFTDLSRLPLYAIHRRLPRRRSSSTAKHLTGPVWPVRTDTHVWKGPSLRHTHMVLSAAPLSTMQLPAAARQRTAKLWPFRAPP